MFSVWRVAPTLSRWISRVRIPLGAPQHLSRSRRVFRLGLFSFRRMCAKPVRQMCAKPAENRPAIHHGATERTPARTVRSPAAGLSVSPFGPSATALLARLLGLLPAPRPPLGRLASATPRPPLGVRPCPSARLPHRRGPPRPRADHPKRKADRPTERPAPRRSIFPLGARPRPRRKTRAPARRRRHPRGY